MLETILQILYNTSKGKYAETKIDSKCSKMIIDYILHLENEIKQLKAENNIESVRFFDIKKVDPNKTYYIKRVDVRKEYHNLINKINKEKDWCENLIKDFNFIGNTDCEEYIRCKHVLQFIKEIEKKEEI